jgi:transposase
MSRPSVFPAEGKIRILLSVLVGEMTVAEAVRQGVGDLRRQVEAAVLGLWAGRDGRWRRGDRADTFMALGDPLRHARGRSRR